MGAKDGGALAARLSTVFALARASLDAHLKDRPRRWRSLLAGRGKHPARLLEIRTIPAASR
jgi:hypothetical protein